MKPPFKWMGGKSKVVKQIIPHIPKHQIYVEPFFGAGAVLFAKEPSKIEVANDLDENVYNFYKQLRENYDEVMHYLNNIDFSERLYSDCKTTSKFYNDVNEAYKAALFFFNAHASFGAKINGGFGVTKTRSMPIPFFKSRDCLVDIKKRLENVLFLNRDYSYLLEFFDTEDTFFYLDPPYIDTTKYLKCIDHNKFFNEIKALRGKWILSHYYTPDIAKQFEGHRIELIKHKPSLGSGKGAKNYGSECIIFSKNL